MLRGPRSNLYVGQFLIYPVFFTIECLAPLGVYGALFVAGMVGTTYTLVSLVKVPITSIFLCGYIIFWLQGKKTE